MLDTKGKTLNLPQLADELTTASVAHRGLGMVGRLLHTYAADGTVADLPDTAQAVVTAHVPAAPPSPPDWAALRLTITAAGNLNAIKAAVLAYLDAMPK